MKPETLFHLWHKPKDSHHFTGSLAAIFDLFPETEIEVGLKKLYRHNFNEPFENESCKITKTFVYRKKHSYKS
jgi:hypothetical protein